MSVSPPQRHASILRAIKARIKVLEEEHSAISRALEEKKALEEKRSVIDSELEELRDAAEALARGDASVIPPPLRDRLPSGRVIGNMHAAHRIARSAPNAREGDLFIPAINAAGFTQRTLADALGISDTLLSLHRSGVKPIPEKRARRIEELTRWPASQWPVKAL